MDSNPQSVSGQSCPICNKTFPMSEIEVHANKCIFLNFGDEKQEVNKRKRPPSRTNHGATTVPLMFSQASNSKITSKSSTAINQPSPPKKPKIAEDPMSFITPLAKQVQPKNINEFFGQNHVLGPNTVLRMLIEKGDIPNMILWGPPGCGKTSLSGVVQQFCKTDPKKYKFVSLCAATSGVKEVQSIVSAAKMELKFGRKTILFMDEIHRFNKRQQDVFLLHVEKGDIILIGATTENPSFCINNALLSRCRVIVMEKLKTDDLVQILERAINTFNIDIFDDQNPNVHRKGELTKLTIEKSAVTWIADTCDGDARIALSNLQLVLQHNRIEDSKLITVEDIKEGIKKSHLLYDRKGEEHYNIISAVHKCIRASDDNAALYWLSRMIVSGEDPLFIARRLVRAASEDIGNADPNALQLAISTMQGCQLIGMPEADVLLAQCTIYLARAPKSREADSALGEAKRLVKECEGVQPSVPMHLRNAPTKLMKDLGYGKADPKVRFSNMPPGLEDHDFFS